MHKSSDLSQKGNLSRRKKFLGLSMGLLCLDSMSPSFAHAPMPSFVPTSSHGPTHSGNFTSHFSQQGAAHSQNSTGQNSTNPWAGLHGITPGHNHHSGVNNSINFVSHNSATNGRVSSFTTEIGQQGRSLDLDLSSTNRDIVLGSSLFRGGNSVTINVGGSQQTYSAGSRVTAGEYVAVREALGKGGQTITLDASGAASGGTFATNGIVNSSVTGLVIPKGVTAVDYFGARSLSLSGDLLNYGSLYGVSTNANIHSGSILAANIINEMGGVISTDLTGGPLIANAISGVSLNLGAQGDITNHGTISSAGSLNLWTATGSIVNTAGVAALAAKAPVPTISAHGDVNLYAGSGNIVNSGVVSSAQGNINISAPDTANVNIAATGGTFCAQSGDINVRNPLYNGAANVNMTGGDYFSNNLNIASGDGQIVGHVGEVSGKLNTSGDAAHFMASSSNLVLGTNKISGDPTYVNDVGDITIDGNVTAAEAITIIAAGDINATGDAWIHTNNSSGVSSVPSTDVTLIAGANVATSGTTTANVPGFDIGNGFTATVSSTGAQGGSIDLTGSSHFGTIIDTSSNLVNSGQNQVNGGGVKLIAYTDAATGKVGGQVQVPQSDQFSIDTSSAHGLGGFVYIVAGAQPASGGPATAVSMGSINAGGAVSGGSVSIYTAAPTGTATYGSNGSLTSGNITSGVMNSGAAISLGDVNASGGGGVANQNGAGGAGGQGGLISINAGGTINVGAVSAYGGGGAGGAGGGVQSGVGPFPTDGFAGGAGGNGGTISISSIGANVNLNGDINASGGGGGGGGGAGSPTVAGANTGVGGSGGAGGSSGGIGISSATSQVSFFGNVYAVAGGAGGKGGDGNNDIDGGAGGGGGGGSYGGGGGGGGGGYGVTNNAAGGGGGAGNFGGGAGESANFAANQAGGGGGIFGGGAGGGTGAAGGAGFGGSINAYSASISGGVGGAALGQAGTGGGIFPLSGATATAGADGSAASGGNFITVQGSGILTNSAFTGGKIIGSTITMTSNPGSNGFIAIQDEVIANKVVFNADGFGNVQTNNFTEIKTADLTATTGAGGNISLLATNNGKGINVAFNAGGNVDIDTEGDVMTIAGTGSSTGNNITLSGEGIVLVNQKVLAAGTMDLNTNNINNNQTLQSQGQLTVTGDPTSPLTVINKGLMQSVNEGISITSGAGQDLILDGGGNFYASGAGGKTINLTATNLAGSNPNIHFTGAVSFNFTGVTPSGTINMNASGAGQSIIVDPAAVVFFLSDNTTVNLNTTSLVVNGSFSSVGSNVQINLNAGNSAGTIASQNSIDLSTLPNLTFQGQNLVILSTGDVTDGGNNVTIDLHNTAGDGGILTIAAGFAFTPVFGGVQGPDATNYKISDFSGTGGKIDLTNTSIVTTGTSNGGSVNLVAAQDATTGDIQTDGGSGKAGNISVLAQSGITLAGPLTAHGGSGDGAISLTSAKFAPVHTPQTVGGVIAFGSFQVDTSKLQGAVVESAGKGSVSCGQLTVVAASVGTKANPFAVDASSMTFNSTGDVYVTNNASFSTLRGTNTANNLNISMLSGGLFIDGSTNVSNTLTLATPGLSQINLAKGSLIGGFNIFLETEDVDNSGTINCNTLNIDHSTGSLFIDGSGTWIVGNLNATTTGNLDFNGLIKNGAMQTIPGENIMMVAGGDISASGGGSFTVNLDNSTGNPAGRMLMFAGMNYTLSGTDIVFDGKNLVSFTGGSVRLDGSAGTAAMTSFSSRDTKNHSNDGSLQLIAADFTPGNAAILLPSTSTVDTGFVELFTQGNAGLAINVGTIKANAIFMDTGDLKVSNGGTNQTAQYHNTIPTTAGQVDVTPGGSGDINAKALTGGGEIIVYADGSLTVPTLSGNDIELTAANGILTIPNNISTGVLDSGGTIKLNGAFVVGTGAGPIVLNATPPGDLNGKGFGGFISLTTQSDIHIGTGNGEFELLANGGPNGGDGGTVNVAIVNASFSSMTIDSAQLQAKATGTTARGGSVSLSAPFIFSAAGKGPISIHEDGVGNAVLAGDITINTSGQITLGTGQDQFDLTARSGFGANDSGTISLHGDELVLGDVTSVNLMVAPQGSVGAGGHLVLHADSDIQWNGMATTPLALAVNATGIFNAGSIDVAIGGNSPLEIGFGPGDFNFQAIGGLTSGNGGAVSFTNGGNVIYIASITSKVTHLPALVAAPNAKAKFGDGGSITLASTNGLLAVKGNLAQNGKGATGHGGKGGNITLVGSGTNLIPMLIGNTKSLNGTTGSLSVSGAAATDGTITIKNVGTGSDLVNSARLTDVDRVTLQADGQITAGTLGSSTTTRVTLTATGVTGTVLSGTLAGKAVFVTADNTVGQKAGATLKLQITAPQICVNAKTSDVFIESKTKGAQILPSSAGRDFYLKNDADIVIAGNVHAVGTLTITNTGSQKVTSLSPTCWLLGDNAVVVSGKLGTSGTPLQVHTGDLTISSSGDAFVNNNYLISSNFQAPKMSNELIYTTASDMVINGPVGTTSNSNLVFLQANGGGSILQGTGLKASVNGNDVALTSDKDIGAAILPLAINSKVFGFTATKGSVNIQDAATLTATMGKSTALNDIFVGLHAGVNINDMSTLGTTGTGNIIVLADTGLLKVNPNAQVLAHNGFIILCNNNEKLGKIEVGINAQIRTSGTLPSEYVQITIGNPSTAMNTTAPANIVVNQVTTGTVDFGTNGITGKISKSSSTPNAPNEIRLNGSNVNFNTGNLKPTAITLDGNVLIEADPILPGSSAVTLPAGTGNMTVDNATNAGANQQVAAVQSLQAPAVYGTHGITTGGTSLPAVQLANLPVQATSLALSSPASIVADSSNPVSSLVAGLSNVTLVSSTQAGTSRGHASILDNWWATDTELTSGEIPAVLQSDEISGIDSDVSTVVDMTELKPVASAAPATVKQDAPGKPLSGGIAMDIGSGKVVELKKGSVLFAPSVDTVIKTAFGDIKISAKSVALVMSFRNGVAVYDLDDQHKEAVVIKSAGKEFALYPGAHALITAEATKGFEYVNPAQRIAYGKISEKALGSGLKAYTGQFSMPHAMSTVLPLRKLVISNHPTAQKTAARMLKTTAIMMQMGSANYTHKVRPDLTAYNQ